MSIERQWQAHGLDCMVVWFDAGYMPHRNGYVRIPEGHPWHDIAYNEAVPDATPIAMDTEVEDLMEGVGTIGTMILLSSSEESRLSSEREMQYQVRVHGGLTFSGSLRGVDGYWVGFDCAHLDDTPARWTEDAVASEVERLAEQIASRA